MRRQTNKVILFTGLPRQSWIWVLSAIVASFLFHLISITEMPGYRHNPLIPAPHIKNEKVPVNIVPKKKDATKPRTQDMDKIIETPLAKTAAPTVPSRLGAQDHQTDKETRVSNLLPRPTAADPGNAGTAKNPGQTSPARPQVKPQLQVAPLEQMTPQKSEPTNPDRTVLTAPDGTVIVPGKEKSKPRNNYEKLLPSAREMTGQIAAGYQDYVDDKVELGDRIDFNTREFRFIGYFTSMRKALEMVWVYPSEAVRRGLQGDVLVEFTIAKDGSLKKAKVLESSGHKILDDAILDALKLAAPYNPLPDGFPKVPMTVVGSFRYVLTSYAAGP